MHYAQTWFVRLQQNKYCPITGRHLLLSCFLLFLFMVKRTKFIHENYRQMKAIITLTTPKNILCECVTM